MHQRGDSMPENKETGIVNAENHILGRLATFVAKELLSGNTLYIVNAEKVVVSGNPKYIHSFYTQRLERGDPYHGPFFPKTPEGIVRRTIRGMLPKNSKGRTALKRLRVYISVPEELSGKEFKTYEKAENKLRSKFMTLEELSKRLGHN